MPNEKKTLLSIGEASRLMGVSEPALRLWTDEGRLKVFITPGGHRRYALSELKGFMNANNKMPGLKELAAHLEDTTVAHRQIAASAGFWYQSLNKESQNNFASLGRQLLNMIEKYITEPSKQAERLQEIKDIGGKFGELTSGLGWSLTDSVQAFIQHRDPIVSATSNLLKKGGVFNRRLAEAIPLVDKALDDALISLVTAHQQPANKSQESELKERKRNA